MRHTTGLARRGAALGVIAALALLITSCIEGPIAGTPTLALGINPAVVDYQRTELFLGEYADAYTPDAPLTSDGRWDVSVDAPNSGARFKTRMMVVRPTDPAAFNGTVVVEWMNVTGTADLPVEWLTAHNEIVRSGAVWVGVSAQAVGVNQLKTCCAARYGSLDHPGDSYSYDIFTEAAKAIRFDRNVTGGLRPQRLIATGQSQSASRLVTYINAIQPLTNAFDGFLVHSRGASSSSLSQTPLASVTTPSPSLIRDDLDVPVFVVQAEDDVIRSNTAARQPDTANFRMWELAGTSHLDVYTSRLGRTDYGDGTGAVNMFLEMQSPSPAPTGCAASQNAGGLNWTLQAAFRGLDTWLRTGTPPATGPRLDVVSTSPTVLARDAVGNAIGGVRSPHVDAPIARLDGINSGPGFCGLFGSTTPLTPEQFDALYPTTEDFLAQWGASIDELVAGGFLLAVDGGFLRTAAEVGMSPQLPS